MSAFKSGKLNLADDQEDIQWFHIYQPNVGDEPRLTATNKSDSEGQEQSSVGLDRFVRVHFTFTLFLNN